jgi:hypothetical protein
MKRFHPGLSFSATAWAENVVDCMGIFNLIQPAGKFIAGFVDNTKLTREI